MKRICIITARGGSKRIPKKNIKVFCGKPIIAYSIEAAVGSGLFDEIMVSTDSEEITEVARNYGARVPFMRSAKNSDDYASTVDVVKEVLAEYEKRGKCFDLICCIYPTAPFVTAEKLKLALEKMQENGANAIIPVVKFSYPPQRCFIMHKDSLSYKWPQYILSRSQDLEPYYHDVGQFYFVRNNVFKQTGKLVPDNTIPFELDAMEVQDIDNLVDWKLAELKYKLISGE